MENFVSRTLYKTIIIYQQRQQRKTAYFSCMFINFIVLARAHKPCCTMIFFFLHGVSDLKHFYYHQQLVCDMLTAVACCLTLVKWTFVICKDSLLLILKFVRPLTECIGIPCVWFNLPFGSNIFFFMRIITDSQS